VRFNRFHTAHHIEQAIDAANARLIHGNKALSVIVLLRGSVQCDRLGLLGSSNAFARYGKSFFEDCVRYPAIQAWISGHSAFE
jgi:hypothetical protein